jgi:hypothetical protein
MGGWFTASTERKIMAREKKLLVTGERESHGEKINCTITFTLLIPTLFSLKGEGIVSSSQ